MALQCFAVLLLATTCYAQDIQSALPALSDTEQYVEAFAIINMAHRTVLNNILHPTNLTNYQTHYAIIVKVLQDLTTNLVQTNKTYDDIYNDVVGKAIVSAMNSPGIVVAQYVKQFEAINTEVLKKFAKIQEDVCPNVVKSATCNILIDNLYKHLLKYFNPWAAVQIKHLKQIFVTLRDTANMILGYDRTFKIVSQDHSAVKYVVEGKEDLRPLVKKLKNFVNILTATMMEDKDFYDKF